MKKLLLMIALFSGAISEVPRFQANDRKEPSQRVAEKQFWPKRGKRIPRDAGRDDFDDSSGQKPGRSPRFSGTRLLVEPPKLAPLALLRVSLALVFLKDNATNLVSEPLNIKIHIIDAQWTFLPLRYVGNAGYDTGNSDDSRYRTVKPALSILIDFRELSSDLRRSALSCKSEKCRRRAYQWELQKPFYVEEPRWVEIDPLDYADDFAQGLGAADPFVLSRGKKLLELEELEESTDNSNVYYEDRTDAQEKRKKGRWATSKRNEEARAPREEEEEEEEEKKRTRGRGYIGDLDNLQQYDPFFLSRGKRVRVESHGSNDRDRWNREDSQRDRRRREPLDTRRLERTKRSLLPRKEELDKLASIGWSDKEGTRSRKKVWHSRHSKSPSRVKRSYDDLKPSSESMLEEELEKRLIEKYNRLLDVVRTSISSQKRIRRGGKIDIFDILQQPFFISRGKKSTDAVQGGILTKIKGTEPNRRDAASVDILDRLLESLKCSSVDCASDLGRMAAEKAPRDRRGALQDLLDSYDPFYLSRGKRTSEENIPRIAKTHSIAESNATRLESEVTAGQIPKGFYKASKDDLLNFKGQY
ncbi:hypothetical protein KM043_006342 [Ampulex compressa]|nr:hypothetical protein KM043_006342 [Ampulex compressa]